MTKLNYLLYYLCNCCYYTKIKGVEITGNLQRSSNSQTVPTKSALSAAISNLKDSETSQGLKAIAAEHNNLMNIQLSSATVKALETCQTLATSSFAELKEQMQKSEKFVNWATDFPGSFTPIEIPWLNLNSNILQNSPLEQIITSQSEIIEALQQPMQSWATAMDNYKNIFTNINMSVYNLAENVLKDESIQPMKIFANELMKSAQSLAETYSPIVSDYKNVFSTLAISQNKLAEYFQTNESIQGVVSSFKDVAEEIGSDTLTISPTVLTLYDTLNKQQQEQDEIAVYRKEKEKYDSQKTKIPQRKLDELIKAVSAGKATFEDFQKIFPDLNSPTLMSYLIDEPPKKYVDSMDFYYGSISFPNNDQCYFRFKTVPVDFSECYQFKPSDEFSLSTTGDDHLYQLEKEEKSYELAIKANQYSKRAFILECAQNLFDFSSLKQGIPGILLKHVLDIFNIKI